MAMIVEHRLKLKPFTRSGEWKILQWDVQTFTYDLEDLTIALTCTKSYLF